mmetsp:Transcript_45019/g.54109  ORF Transcript_45019/g.54109 Transcript_45019/m.54109 type:complete len:196 (+) Transcript_45019:1-588(+)
MVYNILIKKRGKLRGYVPNIGHKHIQKIEKYLTPEERNYWWRMNHNIISTKRTEHKYKRDKNGNLTTPQCPVCKTAVETKEHYNYECPQLATFRQNIATLAQSKDFTRDTWMLQSTTTDPKTTILIAKARWVFHCERCNIDHHSSKRLHQQIVLQRTKKRMTTVPPDINTILNPPKKPAKPKKIPPIRPTNQHTT